MDRLLPRRRKNPSRGGRAAAAAISVLPLDVLQWEILLLLPAAALLRCRAVCRSWRGLTTAADFLLAHHRLRPLLPLLVLFRSSTNPAGPERGQPLLGFDDYDHGYFDGFTLHASWDGLLLASNHRYNGRFLSRRHASAQHGHLFSMCNPATRQRAPVPGLNAARPIKIEALYLHRPSGEYRVLYWYDRRYQTDNGDTVCYILMVPRAHKPRRVVVPAAYLRMTHTVMDYPDSPPPVMFRNCLHWDPSLCSIDNAMVVFDTVSESFRSMHLLAVVAADTNCCTLLHNMEGLIGLSCFDDDSRVAKFWILEDYDSEVWSFRSKIYFSPEARCNLAKTSQHLVLSNEGDVVLYQNFGWYKVHYKGKFLEEFQWESWDSTLTGHLFKESLVNHAFFPKPGSAPTVRQSCLFVL